MSPMESSGKKRAKNRMQTSLPASLDNNLHAYATAACAAGVSLLASATPAAAKIVYTPANAYILPKGTLNLDLNHDGIADFQFSNHLSVFSGGRNSTLKVLPQSQRNAIWGTGTYASALAGGVEIGANKHLQSFHNLMVKMTTFSISFFSLRSKGPWADVTRRYLGLKFSIKGKIHYGWARLNVTVTLRGNFAVLTGYAYETEPNKAIVTGQTKRAADVRGAGPSSSASFQPSTRPPVSLGLLAQGARGLDIWRKRSQ
jgi:hypothetical protein